MEKMNRKRKAAGLALVSSLATGAGVIGTYVVKTSKDILYRIKKDQENDPSLQSVVIKNKQGVKLHGYVVLQEHATQTMVLLHPFKKDARYMKPYLEYLKARMKDTNFFLIDARSHGLSDGYMRGLGIKDVDDLVCWNEYILNEFGNDHNIIIYGKEMGASTAIMAAGKHVLKNVSMIISDGAYTSFYQYAKDQILRKDKMPNQPTISLIKMKIKADSNINIKEDVVRYARHNDIPTLYIHAKDDELVSLKHVYPFYNANRGSKELFVLKDEKQLYEMEESDGFRQTFMNFMQKYK